MLCITCNFQLKNYIYIYDYFLSIAYTEFNRIMKGLKINFNYTNLLKKPVTNIFYL